MKINYMRLLIVLISVVIILFPAQQLKSELNKFDVISFVEDGSDLTARKKNRKDSFGSTCGVIKILTDVGDVNFEGNYGVAFKESSNEEFQLFLSPGTSKITISKTGFEKKEYMLPRVVESNMVYVLKLSSKVAINRKIIDFSFKYVEDSIFVSLTDQPLIMSRNKKSIFRLKEGTYSFTFKKIGCKDIERNINITGKKSLYIYLDIGSSTLDTREITKFKIKTNVPLAEVSLGSQILGKTQLEVSLIAGKRYEDFTVLKDGYKKYYRRRLAVYKTIPEIDIKLIALFQNLNVATIPKGSKIYINDEYLGVTPLVDYKFSNKILKLRLEKELYHTEKKEIDIERDKSFDYKIKLRPKFGDLTITSRPSGGIVFLNDIEVGKTPYRDSVLVSDKYDIRINKEFWQEAKHNIRIYDTNIKKRHFELLPNSELAKVSINSEMPDSLLSDIMIVLNDKELIGYNVRDNLFLEAGSYKLVFEHPEYFNGTFNLELDEFDAKDLVLVLESVKERKSFWSKNKWSSLVLTLASIGVSWYSDKLASEEYKEYLSAGSSTTANENYDKVILYDNIRNYSAGASVLSFYWFFHSAIKEAYSEKE